MESSGVPGQIQVSAATHALLTDRFTFEARGPIEVKGKGTMETFMLVAHRAERRTAGPGSPSRS
jgi:class 3 adenylate cyclase